MGGMNVIGIDPGLTTGIALWNGEQQDVTLQAFLHHSEAVPFVWQQIYTSVSQPLTVVAERFDVGVGTTRKTWQPEALYVIGAVLHMANQYHVPFESQSRADAKHFADDQKLSQLGLRVGNVHARDATRQVILWLSRKSQPEFVNLYRRHVKR